MALPLYFQNRQLGFMLLAVDARGAGFTEVLREQISTALAGLFLREQIRRAWQEAEDASRLKSRFLATVSHELRTPLSLIVGTIEMMQREDQERGAALPEDHRRDLASIHASAQHLAHLIADVLDLASSQAGELRLTREPMQLSDLLARVITLAEPMAREKGLTWETEFPPHLPLVLGDRTRLQQVILNLVSNAVKFTEQGSVSLWVEIGKKEVVIAVSDSGLGIPVRGAGNDLQRVQAVGAHGAARLRRDGPRPGDQPPARGTPRRPDRRALDRQRRGGLDLLLHPAHPDDTGRRSARVRAPGRRRWWCSPNMPAKASP